MTSSERNRFILLIVLLVVLIGVALIINRFRKGGSVGADILGVIQNQAVATFKDLDGINQQPSLSDISSLTVASGKSGVTLTYKLGGRTNQSAKLDIQFFKPEDDAPLTSIKDKNGNQGTLVAKLANIPNGSYDIATKPVNFLSQVVNGVNYANGKPTTIDYPNPFLWGDIDVSHGGKGDNAINNADWSILVKAWNTADPTSDYNGDGVVNNADATVILNNWNKQGDRFTVEEPTDTTSAPPEL